jgi:hypothetical protein
MSFRLDLQSAPVRRGTIGTPDTGSWTGPTPTMSGIYTGSTNKTLTFGVTTLGVIETTSTIVVNWSDGTLSGYLNLGTDHDYSVDDALLVTEGVYVAFGAGTVISGTFTVALVAVNALRDDHQLLVADAAPVDIFPTFSRTNMDPQFTSWKGNKARVRAAIMRDASISVDWLDSDHYDVMSYMESERHPVTLGEDYDDTTVLLWRAAGTGLLPFVGSCGTFARSGIGTYVDPRSGKIVTAADGVPRLPAGQFGPAMAIDGGTTNVCTRSCAKSGTLYWANSDADSSVAFDATVLGPNDPDDANVPSGFRTGVLRFAFASTATALTDSVNTTNETVVESTQYTASIWLKGHGLVTFQFRAGAASPSTVRGTVNITLTDTWTRYECTGTTAAGEVVGDLAITPQNAGGTTQRVGFAFGWQLEAKPAATALVYTDGSSLGRGAETMTFPVAVPVPACTVSFWLYWGGDDSTSTTYGLVEGTGVSGAQRFLIGYNSSSSTFFFFTSTSSTLSSSAHDVTRGELVHVAVTVAASSTVGSVDRTIYLNGVAVAGPTATTAWEPTFGTGIKLCASLSAVTNVGSRIHELRIDSEAKSAAEILDLYNRYADDGWKNNVQNTYGRAFWLEDLEETWRFEGAPNQILARATLREAYHDPDSTLVAT